jgi:hypothetical protein
MLVLQFINGGTLLITENQAAEIDGYLEKGTPKVFKIGEERIILHQISGISTKGSYVRQMNEKFSHSGKSICYQCFRAVPYSDKCACKSDPKNFPPLLETSRRENPKLAQLLDAAAAKMSLPSPKPDEGNSL